MSLSPLLSAPSVIQLHAFAAMAALTLGIIQFALPKGTQPHRTVGWIWVALMATVALSSFWMHGRQNKVGEPWSPVHLLSIFTLIMLPLGTWCAHRRHVRGHRITMASIFAGGLVIAGLFTFVPGRIMHAVAVGPQEPISVNHNP